MVIVKQFSDFRGKMKAQQFFLLRDEVLRVYGTDPNRRALLLGNLKVGAYDFDAVLITDTWCTVFEFKEQKGGKELRIMPNGWFFGNKKVWSGKLHADTPKTQMRIKRNILWGYLKKHVGGIDYIQVVISFQKSYFTVSDPYEILATCRWLDVATIQYALKTAQDIHHPDKIRIQIDWDKLLAFFRVNCKFGACPVLIQPFPKKQWRKKSLWSRIVALFGRKAS